MPRRHRFVVFIALIVVSLYAVGCSSTSRLRIQGGLAPNASVGTTYTSSTFTAVDGSGTYTWTIIGLPPGLTASGLNTVAATVAGTPTTLGTYSVSITLTDSSKSATTYTGSITVAASSALTINGTLPLTGSVGTAYSGTLTATGGTAPYTWTITGLPAGVTTSNEDTATVTASGTPTSAGTDQVSITLTDSAGGIAKSTSTVKVSSSAILSITGALAGTATVGSAYSGALTASSGTMPYSWTVSGLPAGITATDLSAATVGIAGTPTTAGSYDVSALVTDAKSTTALYTVTITVSTGGALTAGACTAKPGLRGNEANFAAPYAFLLQGTDAKDEPAAWAGSFTPDGKGGITAADVDAISQEFGPASYQLDLARSSYSFGADGRGCLYLAFGGINDPAGAPSNIPDVLFSFTVSMAYQTGRIVQSENAGSGVATAGQMHRQTPSEFAPLSTFGSNYAFGLSGWHVAGTTGSLDRAAIAGSLTLATDTGSFTDINADENLAGTASGALTGGSGTFGQFISSTTGRTTGSFTINGAAGSTSFNFAAYIVNHSDFFIITIDRPTTNAYLLTGRALQAAPTSTALAGKYMLALTGVDFSGGSRSGNHVVQLGLLGLSGTSVSLDLFVSEAGASTTGSLTGTASTDNATGRVAFTGVMANPPIAYLTATADEDSIAAFLVGTDRNSSSGFLALQTLNPDSGGETDGSVSGPFSSRYSITNGILTLSADTAAQPLLHVSIAQSAQK